MNDRLALQRLWWKELRQLLPLVILLPLLVVAPIALLAWLTEGNPWEASGFILLWMPGLFAAGAGALLVGYEKELRTIDWLSSLPITARRIVRVKVGAALVGLAVLWLLSGLFLAEAMRSLPPGRAPKDLWMSLPLHTLFVLLAGFALAWRVRSALVALLLVVPVATLPYIFADVIDRWVWQTPPLPRPTAGTLLACQLVGVAVAAWLTDRFGRRALAPAAAGGWFEGSGFAAAVRDRVTFQRAGYGRIQSPLPALVWQFVLQSRGVLVGLTVMLAITTLVLGTADLNQTGGGRIVFASMLGLVAISWLGVSVFQSDVLNQRIRFLSDRGISPRATWYTRHAAPASLLALFVLLLLLVSLLATDWSWETFGEVGPALASFTLVAVVIYVFSQWLGQVIVSPIVSAISAPLVALVAIGYGSFAIGMLGTPWWLALLLLAVPVIATRTMTRRWMDRRLGFTYWASHTAFLTVVILLPAMPLLIAIARQPAMPDKAASEIRALARQSQPYRVWTTELVLGEPESSLSPETTPAERVDDQLDHIETQLSESSRPIGSSSARVIEFLRSTATLSRKGSVPPASTSITDEPSEASESDDVPHSQQRYRRAIRMLVDITTEMRRSFQLRDQDTADLIEIWLLAELGQDQARQWLGESLYEATAAMLANRQSRQQARRRAIALSWEIFQTADRRNRVPSTLGGYTLDDVVRHVGTLQGGWVSQRRVGVAVADLWDLAQEGSAAATPDRLRRIAEYWRQPLGRYGIGPAGPYLRADDLDRFVHQSLNESPRAIASQWFADWERLATERHADRSNNTNGR